jgi:hypothetical protein
MHGSNLVTAPQDVKAAREGWQTIAQNLIRCDLTCQSVRYHRASVTRTAVRRARPSPHECSNQTDGRRGRLATEKEKPDTDVRTQPSHGRGGWLGGPIARGGRTAVLPPLRE